MLNRLIEIYKNMEGMEIALIIMITVVVALCLLFLSLAVVRRLYNAHRYRILDNLRVKQRTLLQNYIQAKQPSAYLYLDSLRARPGSKKWIALEDNLFSLITKESTRTVAGQLFEQLGYVDYYLKTLNSRNVIARAGAVAKLGRMESRRSAQPLLAMLDTGSHEIITVAVLALSKLGDNAILFRLLDKLPELLKKDLVTKKTIDTSLVVAGPRITPILLAFGKTCSDPGMIASLLGVLNAFPANREVYDFAVSHLGHADAEVRTKALKVIEHCEIALGIIHEEALLPLLKDPVWFVRLQAVRTIGNRKSEKNVREISPLVLDEKWQVRNAAAMALTLLCAGAIDAFLSLLHSTDHYAKESVCEELEKTNFVDLLLELLTDSDKACAVKAREILSIMASCGFSSPLKEFAATCQDPMCTNEIDSILAGASSL